MGGKTKKSLAFVLILMLTLAVLTVSAAEPRYYEDFQNRTVYVPSGSGWGPDVSNNVAGLASGSGKVLVDGELKTSSVFGGGYWVSYYAIEKEMLSGNTLGDQTLSEESNVLCLKANSADKPAVMNLIKNMGTFENGFVFSADIRNVYNGQVPPVSGIRLAKAENEADYYELSILKNQEDYRNKGTSRFIKNTGAAAEDAISSDESIFEYIAHGAELENGLPESTGYKAKWFNFQLSVVRNFVSYKITDKTDSTVIWQGSFADTENMLQNGFVPQLFMVGTNSWVYFDNLSVSEPQNASSEGFTDDFETYTVGTSVSGKSSVLAENAWVSSTSFGDTAAYAIANDEELCNNWGGTTVLENKVLSLMGGSDALAVMNVAADVTDEGNGYTFKADVRNYLYNGNINTANGLRLAQAGNEANYYELALTADSATWKGTAPRFTKAVGADKDTANTPDSSAVKMLYEGASALGTGHGDVSGWNGTRWFTAEITVNGKNVSWKITDMESGNTVWNGSFRDEEDFLSGGICAQLFAYGASSKAYFDNVSFAPASAETTKKSLVLFSDDIEARPIYEATGNGLGEDYNAHVPGVATGSGYNFFEGVWQTSPTYGGVSWSSDYRIMYGKELGNAWNSSDPTTENKVIKMAPLGSNTAALNMVQSLSGLEDGFIFSADVRNIFEGKMNESTGIRLVEKDNEANYYELALRLDTTETKDLAGGVKGVAKTPRFTKVTGGDINTTNIHTQDSAFDYVAYGENVSECELVSVADVLRTNWFTLTMAVKGKEVSWSVTNRTTGNTDWSGSYEFDEEINAANLMPQLYTYTSQNSSAQSYFDNIKVIKNGIALNKISSSAMNIDASLVNAPAGTKLITAYYDAEGVLISAETVNLSTSRNIYKEISMLVPNGTAAAKAFVIKGFETLAPLTKADMCDF